MLTARGLQVENELKTSDSTDQYNTRCFVQGEERILFALLVDAINVIWRQRQGESLLPGEYHSAKEWLIFDGCEYPRFNFTDVCNFFNLNSEHVRNIAFHGNNSWTNRYMHNW